MDRKKLIKLGISVLAVNALGAVAVYKYPELTHVPTVYAEEQPGEDEEIPDAAEAQAATNFKNQMDEFEKAINEFNPDDSDTKESLQYALEDAEGYHTTAVNAIKSEEGKKGFAKYEARYQALKAKAQALLNGESPKPQPDPQPQPQPDPQPQPKITTQDLTVKEPILYGSSGASIYMDTVSVGATINTMLAAVRASGRTVIENAAREPEIIDVATLLNNMGAHIRGAGTDIITIEGVDKLHGTRHQVIPDRIEAGTYISLAAAVGQGVQINNVLYEHLEGFIAKLEEMGVRMTVSEDSIYVEEQRELRAINIKTAPYPGFATDLQQPITPLLLKAKGRGMIMDTIYEKRINHVPELAKMTAKISSTSHQIIYEGPNQLHGAAVKATDLRAGAALVIAGLMAKGRTEITNIEFILRGYSNIIEKLKNLGADIELVEEA